MNNDDAIIIKKGEELSSFVNAKWVFINAPIFLFGPRSLSAGYILVKENKFTQKIILDHIDIKETAVEGLFNQAVPNTGTVRYNLASCSEDVIKKILKISTLTPQQREQVNNVYNMRKDGISISSALIELPNKYTIIKRKLESKTGVKFGNFFQKYIKLPASDLPLDTLTSNTLTKEKVDTGNVDQNGNPIYAYELVRADFDVDYQVRIVDVEKFIKKFNIYYETKYDEAFFYVLNDFAKYIEKDIKKYFNSHSLESVQRLFTNNNSDEELYVFSNTVEKAKNEYGIQVVEFKFGYIGPDKSIVDASNKIKETEKLNVAKVKDAEGDKQARILRSEGEAQAIRNEEGAKAETRGQMAQNLIDALHDPSSAAYAMADHSNNIDLTSQGKTIKK